MRDYSGIVMNLRLLAADLETAYGEERGSSLYSDASDAIEELLAERTAFWVDTQPHLDDSSYKKDGMSYYCSNCHHRAGKYKHRSYKFCPWCGAKIVPKEMAVRNED